MGVFEMKGFDEGKCDTFTPDMSFLYAVRQRLAKPDDAIVLQGSGELVPETLFAQLKDGGRLVAILSEAGISRAVVWRRNGSSFDQRAAFDARADVLPGFEVQPEFSL